MASSLAQYLAYSQPQGTGQSAISPLAMKLSGKQRTHWAELLGDLAMVGADQWKSDRASEDRTKGLAEMLSGGAATLGGDESIGVPDTANPWHDGSKYSQMSQLLAGNPEMAPFFQAQAMEKQFPEVFGQAPELGKVYDPASGNYVYGPITEGAIAEPGGTATQNKWAAAGDGTFYRTGANGELEFSQAPGGGGGIPGLAGAPGGGGAAPMQAISQIESGGNPNATSPKNAIGEFQILTKDPATGQPGATALEIATELGDQFAIDMLQQGDVTGFEQYVRDPQINAQYGEHYFNKMKEKYGGNDILAAAAYNAGPGRVDDALAASGGDPNAFFAALPAETQDYVQKFAGMTGGGQAESVAAPGQGAEALAAGVPYPRAKSDNEHEANALYLREQAMAQGIELPAQTQAYIDAYAPTEKGPEFDRQVARYNEIDAKVQAGTATEAERNERKALKKKLGLGSNYTGTETQGRYLAGAKALDNLLPALDDLLAKGYQPDGMAQVLNGLQGEGDSLWSSIANSSLSPDDQVFFQILYQLSDAVNRPVSGAAITKEDLKNAFRQYVPMAGDSPATIQRKKDALLARRVSFYNVAGFEGEDIPEITSPSPGPASSPPPPAPAKAPGAPLRFNPATGMIE